MIFILGRSSPFSNGNFTILLTFRFRCGSSRVLLVPHCTNVATASWKYWKNQDFAERLLFLGILTREFCTGHFTRHKTWQLAFYSAFVTRRQHKHTTNNTHNPRVTTRTRILPIALYFLALSANFLLGILLGIGIVLGKKIGNRHSYSA
jgi:hypothetical protein